MSISDGNLITSYNFQGHDYLVKLNNTNDYLEMNFTDKQSGEQWECSYEASYIEGITKKTGNFKQFEIFATMLKSGLLKTSSCITLDLLTYDDLESLRTSRLKNASIHKAYGRNNNNRRYLIVTYSVEFDKINYPLPLEYCGLPDPVVLQATIKRLEAELVKTNDKRSDKNNSHDRQKIRALQKRIEELVIENLQLNEKIQRLTQTKRIKKSKPQVEVLQKAITQLEKNVVSERNSHHKLVEKLQTDKMFLAQQIEMLRVSEEAMKNKLLELSRLSQKQNKKRQDTTKPFNSNAFRRQKSPNLLPHLRSRSVSPTFFYDSNWKKQGKDKCVQRSKSGESRSSSISSVNRQFLQRESSRSVSPNTKQLPRSRSNSRESVKSVKRQSRKSKMKKRSESSLAKSASDDVEEYETQIRQLYHNKHHSRRF